MTTPSTRPSPLAAASTLTPQGSVPLSRALAALKLVAETARNSTTSSGSAFTNSGSPK